ncbi:hypothetical protein KJB62_12690 [Staphylococcus saprophyticus]|uniref:hypothetical protein n=1 Tax=Staphylococcus saprophyticus TaxID=29385 RepID=UPI001F31E29E|nr:hypothetical protein [Staphylococcus saprophyticus]MCE5132225.1 hypothetical protein [Staphylococcus saprophyticus]
MSENSAIFLQTDDYYFGIYVARNGSINGVGKTLIKNYDFDQVIDLVDNKQPIEYLEKTVAESKNKTLTSTYEYFVACCDKDSLTKRQCFIYYGDEEELMGEGIDYTFIPYTSIEAKYIYLMDSNENWLVSHEGSDYVFEDLKTNVDRLSN